MSKRTIKEYRKRLASHRAKARKRPKHSSKGVTTLTAAPVPVRMQETSNYPSDNYPFK